MLYFVLVNYGISVKQLAWLNVLGPKARTPRFESCRGGSSIVRVKFHYCNHQSQAGTFCVREQAIYQLCLAVERGGGGGDLMSKSNCLYNCVLDIFLLDENNFRSSTVVTRSAVFQTLVVVDMMAYLLMLGE